MTRRSGLGKGLSSLIPPADGGGGAGGDQPVLVEIPIADVVPNPHQPRVHFDEETLGELAASIAQLGVLQPVLVRRVDDRYQLIAGERRWRAARRAGLTTVPAVVRTSDDVSAVEQALVENLHRQDLTPLEEAAAYQQLIEDFELTHDEVAQRVGKSRSAITNTLRLLGLPPGGPAPARRRQAVRRPRPGAARHARPGAAGAAGPPGGDEGWSVRTVEEAVRNGGVLPAPTPAPRRRRAPTADRRRRPQPTATRLRPPGPARARAAARRRPRHPRRRADGRQAGQGDDRLRRPRGPRADLPPHRRRALTADESLEPSTLTSSRCSAPHLHALHTAGGQPCG